VAESFSAARPITHSIDLGVTISALFRPDPAVSIFRQLFARPFPPSSVFCRSSIIRRAARTSSSRQLRHQSLRRERGLPDPVYAFSLSIPFRRHQHQPSGPPFPELAAERADFPLSRRTPALHRMGDTLLTNTFRMVRSHEEDPFKHLRYIVRGHVLDQTASPSRAPPSASANNLSSQMPTANSSSGATGPAR